MMEASKSYPKMTIIAPRKSVVIDEEPVELIEVTWIIDSRHGALLISHGSLFYMLW